MFWHHIDTVDDLVGVLTMDVSFVCNLYGEQEEVVTYTCIGKVQDDNDDVVVLGKEVFVLNEDDEEFYESAVFARRVSKSGAVNRCLPDRCSEGPQFDTLEEALQWLVT